MPARSAPRRANRHPMWSYPFHDVGLEDRGGGCGVVDGDDDRAAVAAEDLETGSAMGDDAPPSLVAGADHPSDAPAAEVGHGVDLDDSGFRERYGRDAEPRPAEGRPDHESARSRGDDELRRD